MDWGWDAGGRRASAPGTRFARYRPSLNAESFFQRMHCQLLANNRDMIVSGNESEEEIVARSIAGQHFSVILLGIFAALALLCWRVSESTVYCRIW